MAKFKYSMESILNLRIRFEDLKKQEFGEAIKKLEREKLILKNFILRRDKSVADYKIKVETSIDPKETKVCYNFIESMKIKIEKQMITVNKAIKHVEEKRQELILATQEKKKLEKLKENEYEDYVIEEKRKEQKITDEIVSYQYHG